MSPWCEWLVVLKSGTLLGGVPKLRLCSPLERDRFMSRKKQQRWKMNWLLRQINNDFKKIKPCLKSVKKHLLKLQSSKEDLNWGPLGCSPHPQCFGPLTFPSSLLAHCFRQQGSWPSPYKHLLREVKGGGPRLFLLVSVGSENIAKWKSWCPSRALTQAHTKQPKDIFRTEGMARTLSIMIKDIPPPCLRPPIF